MQQQLKQQRFGTPLILQASKTIKICPVHCTLRLRSNTRSNCFLLRTMHICIQYVCIYPFIFGRSKTILDCKAFKYKDSLFMIQGNKSNSLTFSKSTRSCLHRGEVCFISYQNIKVQFHNKHHPPTQIIIPYKLENTATLLSKRLHYFFSVKLKRRQEMPALRLTCSKFIQ